MTPRDILAFELGPFGEFDARYLKWLADVVVKRGWKDLLSAVFGYGLFYLLGYFFVHLMFTFYDTHS